ncbi:MAG: hypothetical protein ACLQPH_01660 [Acidimicrobiales bacterium]
MAPELLLIPLTTALSAGLVPALEALVVLVDLDAAVVVELDEFELHAARTMPPVSAIAIIQTLWQERCVARGPYPNFSMCSRFRSDPATSRMGGK